MIYPEPFAQHYEALVAVVGDLDPASVHFAHDRLVVHFAEFHRYLVIEQDGREWWTNALLLVWPDLVSAEQYAMFATGGIPDLDTHAESGSGDE